MNLWLKDTLITCLSRTASIKDNWDLSVLRATAVVRILQDDFKVDPKRMTAAGRSQYVPVVGNDTAQERAKNRRTRIVVLPKSINSIQ